MDNITTSQRLTRLETVQDVVLDISRRSARCLDLHEFFRAVHEDVGRIMYARNFYIALRDENADIIRYAYDVDEKDGTSEPNAPHPLLPISESPTAWVIRRGESLSVTAESFAEREADGPGWGTGANPEHWLGMPLIDSEGRTFGAVVVQSYTLSIRYSVEDIALFELISHHVAHAVEQTQFTHRLERAIVDRTRSLEHEVAERRRGEKLQRALYEISALSVRSIKLDTFYAELHRIMGELLYAKNLIVTHFNETDNFISFPYYADEKDPAPPHDYRRPSGYGLTGFVMNTRMPQRIDQVRYQKLLDEGVLHSVIGSIDFNVWIGAPMIYQERLLGVIILQSYDITIGYDNDDLELLTFVADHIAAALSRKQTDDSLRSAHADLASSSNAIREKNCELERTLDDLRLTQNELMRQEKLASLGALVAGVAHEINTPIGIAITAASHLQDQAQRIANHRKSGNSTTSMLESFEPVAIESCAMVLRNLRRADELIRSFKQVAVDQSSEQRRSFFLHSYLDEILISLQPQIKRARHKTFVQCPEEILLDTFPAAIYQTLVNLVMNSLVHGFEHMDEGEIRVEVSSDLDNVLLTYSDNGCGMTDDVVAHIFDPFFTTRRGRGGTGLGMHIVYNLVTQVLLGRIDVSSVLGEGTKIAINIPRTNPGCNKQPAAPSLA